MTDFDFSAFFFCLFLSAIAIGGWAQSADDNKTSIHLPDSATSQSATSAYTCVRRYHDTRIAYRYATGLSEPLAGGTAQGAERRSHDDGYQSLQPHRMGCLQNIPQTQIEEAAPARASSTGIG